MKLNSVAGGVVAALAVVSIVSAAVGVHMALNANKGDDTIKSSPIIEFVNPPLVGELINVEIKGQFFDIDVIRIVDKEKGVVCYLRGAAESRPMECLHDLSIIEKEMTPSEEELAWMDSKK